MRQLRFKKTDVDGYYFKYNMKEEFDRVKMLSNTRSKAANEEVVLQVEV